MLMKSQTRRALARPRAIFPALVFFVIIFWMGMLNNRGAYTSIFGPGERLNVFRDPEERREQALQDQRKLFEQEFNDLTLRPGFGAIYGGTLTHLVDKDTRRPDQSAQLTATTEDKDYSKDRPYIFNPYPKYNSHDWKSKHFDYVPCVGPSGSEVEDIRVFKGRPRNFPNTGFGSYSLLGLDRNLCFERETRMGQYGLETVYDKEGEEINWDMVDWGALQNNCVAKNSARFASSGPENPYVEPEDDDFSDVEQGNIGQKLERIESVVKRFWRQAETTRPVKRRSTPSARLTASQRRSNSTIRTQEPRTAVLLRSYTGKEYTENDKVVIRSLITEMNLRTGGEYQVFLFVHVRESDRNIWESEAAYNRALQENVPREFWGITILWNEPAVDRRYPRLSDKPRRVHNGQFLSVQMFMQEFREFEFAWNWEMDSRVVGHHYDMLHKLAEFGKKQPRRGLWERNERFYIPSFHGGYDTKFRHMVERASAGESVWGPPDVPVVKAKGPRPPVKTPQEDVAWSWGVGEEADLITLAPIFNPVNSGWVMRNQVWGYRSRDFPWGDLPRRATIITQARVSRRLIDIMHMEDLRGNHVASEMVTQTTALLHGLKAVYAPMPVFFDRDWDGAQLAKWFNGGPKGESGSFGSAMGWGQEGRYGGSTWYYRALPPQRLYNNWMGYEDTAIGGPDWERWHGRTCLPTMILHPVKEIKPTEKGFVTESKLPYD